MYTFQSNKGNALKILSLDHCKRFLNRFLGSTFADCQSVFIQPTFFVQYKTDLVVLLKTRQRHPQAQAFTRPLGPSPPLLPVSSPHSPSFSFQNVPLTIPSHGLCTCCPLCPGDKYFNLCMSRDLDKVKEKPWIQTNNPHWLSCHDGNTRGGYKGLHFCVQVFLTHTLPWATCPMVRTVSSNLTMKPGTAAGELKKVPFKGF